MREGINERRKKKGRKEAKERIEERKRHAEGINGQRK